MTIEKVIELGEGITKPNYPWHSEFTIGIWVLIIILVLLGGMLVHWGNVDFGVGRGLIGSMTLFTATVIFIAYLVSSDAKEDEVFDKKVEEWKNEIVKPYIESLPKQQKEIIYIKIDPELSHEVEGRTWWGAGYTRSTAVERTPLTVSYKDNGIITRSNWYETFMELTDKERPYIEYQYLEKDVGHGIKKGIYNAKVYLPESYTFTDIK